jgi:hypothetical protein
MSSPATAAVVAASQAPATGTQYLTPRQVLQRLTRLQGPEIEQTMNFTPVSPLVLPNSIKTDKFIWGMLVRFHGRITTGVTGFAPLPNALWNLIQEFKVYGTHAKYGAQVPFRLRGASVRDYSQIFGNGFNPFATVLKAGVSGNFDGTASTNFDVDVEWLLIFPPGNLPLADQIVHGALKGPDWAGDLHLEMDTADGTALGTTAANITFTAYGSGSGSPQLLVSTIRPNMTVALMNAISPAICFKSYVSLDTLLQGASNLSSAQQIALLNIGKGTTRIILKTGVLQTGVTTGVEAFASLSDSIITNAAPYLDGKPQKNPYSNLDMKQYESFFMQADLPVGYNVLDFIEGKNILSTYPSQGLTAARRFEVDGTWVGAANQGGERIQEELLGSPIIMPVPVGA